MTHVCAWCGRTIREIADGPGENHGICIGCACEQAYARGWNEALEKVRLRLRRWQKQWGGAPRIRMKSHEINGIWYEDGDAREDT